MVVILTGPHNRHRRDQQTNNRKASDVRARQIQSLERERERQRVREELREQAKAICTGCAADWNIYYSHAHGDMRCRARSIRRRMHRINKQTKGKQS